MEYDSKQLRYCHHIVDCYDRIGKTNSILPIRNEVAEKIPISAGIYHPDFGRKSDLRATIGNYG